MNAYTVGVAYVNHWVLPLVVGPSSPGPFGSGFGWSWLGGVEVAGDGVVVHWFSGAKPIIGMSEG